MNEHKYKKNNLINHQVIVIYFFYFTKMASISDNNLNDTHDESNGLMNKIKEFKQDHPVLFWVIIAMVIVVVLIGIIVTVYSVNKKKKKESKEEFSASNDINDEFDYVNSVIYSTLGDVSELEKINSAAVLV